MRRHDADSALMAAACLALLLCGAVHALIPALCLVAIAAKAFVLDPLGLRLPLLLRTLLNAALFGVFVWLSLLRQPPLDFLRVLLTFAAPFLVFRGLHPDSPFNHFLVFLVSLMLVTGCAAVSGGLVPVYVTALFLFVACQALPAITARPVGDDQGVRVRLLGARRWRSAPAWAVHHLAVGGLVAGALLYLVAPRFAGEAEPELPEAEPARLAASGGGSTTSRTTTYQTGFPDEVRIGDIGKIKRKPWLVFRMKLLRYGRPYDPTAQERTMLLLRARAWETYDPATYTWVQPTGTPRALPREGILEPGDTALRYDMEILGYDAHTLFLPQRARIVRSAVRPLYVDDLGVVSSRRPVPEYAVEAAEPPTTRGDLAQVEADTSGEYARLRTMPPALRDALRAHLPPRTGARLAPSVGAILDRFTREFTYTLDLPGYLPAGTDPLLAFLERKEGHCELFATAACMFLRLYGIPARLAGGIRCSERLGPGEYQARFSNSHAWVEVPCRGVGVGSIDFTPPDSRAQGGGDGLDPGEEAGTEPLLPQEGVIDWRNPFEYRREDQQQVVEWIGDQAFSARAAAVIGLLFLGGFLWGAIVALRRRRERDPLRVRAPGGLSRKTLAFYARWLRACAAQGHVRRHAQTPREFLSSLPAALRAQGAAITAEFELRRYGTEAG